MRGKMKKLIVYISLTISIGFSICSYAESKDVSLFRPGTSQEKMLGFLKEEGSFSTNGRYWSGVKLKKFGAFRIDKKRSSSTSDVYADNHGNFMTVGWEQKPSLSLEDRHQGLRPYAENAYKAKWPRGEIIRTDPVSLKYNGCPTYQDSL